MSVINGPAISTHPWDQACRLNVRRGFDSDLISYPTSTLEPGVNFFILALEELGAKTRFSCEGHPYGFYVVFEASFELAVEISKTDRLAVEIWNDAWAIRTLYAESQSRGSYSETMRKDILRDITKSWIDYFGSRLARTLQHIAIGQLVA